MSHSDHKVALQRKLPDAVNAFPIQGKSIPPPSFNLAASPIQAKKEEAVQLSDPKQDKEIEKKFNEFVKAKKYDEAIRYFFKAYGFETLAYDITIVEPYDAWASVSGQIKEGAKQKLKVGNDLFEQPFNFIARTLGHEWQHIKQRSQKDPLTNQDEREYLAYCFKLLDDSVPAHTNTSEIKQSIKMALKHYGKMPADMQKKHASTKKQIDKLKTKYP